MFFHDRIHNHHGRFSVLQPEAVRGHNAMHKRTVGTVELPYTNHCNALSKLLRSCTPNMHCGVKLTGTTQARQGFDAESTFCLVQGLDRCGVLFLFSLQDSILPSKCLASQVGRRMLARCPPGVKAGDLRYKNPQRSGPSLSSASTTFS